jgi:hypothetical protein
VYYTQYNKMCNKLVLSTVYQPHQEQIINKIRLNPHTWTMFQTAATLYKFLAAKYLYAGFGKWYDSSR